MTHLFKMPRARTATRPRSMLALALAAASSVALLQCARPRTQLVIRAETNLAQGPGGLSALRLQARGLSTDASTGALTVAIGPGGTILPANLLSLTSSGTSNEVTLTLVGVDESGRELARQERVTRFLPGATGWVTLELARECDATLAAACSARRLTCGFGGCTAIARPASPTEPPAAQDAGLDAGEMDGALADATALDGSQPDGRIVDASPADVAADATRPTCSAPQADCDGNPANGCETNLSVSAAHCGRCGMTCGAGAMATAMCSAGTCGIQCADGYGDCDRDGRSCEANLSTSAAHCGRCGASCPSTMEGVGACQAGRCAVTSCATGTANCDMASANGCEVTLATDGANCGMCGNRCGGGTRCEAGRCSDQTLTQLAAGGPRTGGGGACGLRGDASGRDGLVCWGQGVALGGAGSPTPVAGPLFAVGVTPASAGAFAFAATALAMRSSTGDVWTLGAETFGLLGDGMSPARTSFSVVMMPAGMRATTLLAAGPANFCASDGTRLACWGDASLGVAGGAVPFAMTANTPQIIPIELAGAGAGGDGGVAPDAGAPAALVELSVGASFACARTAPLSAGPVLCWGSTAAFAFSDATTEARGIARPVAVRLMDESDLSSIAVGGTHACVAGASGKVYCWGDNLGGQCGALPAPNARPRESVVTDLGPSAGTVQVVAGRAHTCALSSATRRVRCWGDNARGQLGRGMPAGPSSNVLLSAGVELSQVLRITAGPDHTCAIRTDRSVFCWGAGMDGQLGDGTRMDRAFATPIGRLP
jgi:hypothetical protein